MKITSWFSTLLKDAMHDLFTFNHIQAVLTTPVNMKNCQIQLSMHVKILHTKTTVETVWPADLVLFINVSSHQAEPAKQLDFNQYAQLSRWTKGNSPDCGTRGPGCGSGKDF